MDAFAPPSMLAESLVVKHTFLEVGPQCGDLDERYRAMSDTLVDYTSYSHFCKDTDSEASQTTASPLSGYDFSTMQDFDSVPESDSATMFEDVFEQTIPQSWADDMADIDDDCHAIAGPTVETGCFWMPVLLPAAPWMLPVAMLQDMSVATPARSSVSRTAKTLGFDEQEHKQQTREFADLAPATVASSEPVSEQHRTSVKVSGLPRDFTRDAVLQLLDTQGLASVTDFLYMPVDLLTWVHYGYAFVSFETSNAAERAMSILQGLQPDGYELQVEWCQHQGLEVHVERHRNNAVMHHTVPDEYKPLLFQAGRQVDFPPPTKKLQLQRLRQELRRRQRHWQAEAESIAE